RRGGRYARQDHFFFQAEDGIRCFHVTGVQTCALPIFDALFGAGLSRPVEGRALEVLREVERSAVPVCAVDVPSGLDGATGQVQRSEERRVGKEGRSRWAPGAKRERE